MKKLFLFVLLFWVSFTEVKAQSLLGVANSNYLGTNSIYMNPATTADSRHRYHINLATFDTYFTNNYLEFDGPFTLWQGIRGNVDDQYLNNNGNVDFKQSYFKEILDGKAKNFTFSSDIRGPGFMISPDAKNGFALTTRFRTGIELNDVGEPIARFMKNGFDTLESVLHLSPTTDDRFSLNVNAFTELGLSYSRVVMDKRKHFLKAGTTIKRLHGIFSGYFLNKRGVDFTVIARDTMIVTQSDVEYGYTSEEFFNEDNGFKMSDLLFRDRLGAGWGFDFGVVYEFRPKRDDYDYEMDNEMWVDHSKNKYKFRISASLMDFGSIRYDNQDWVRGYEVANNGDITASEVVRWGGLDTLNIDGTAFMDSLISDIVGFQSRKTSFISKLPTALHFQLDYKVFGNVYANVTWIQSTRSIRTVGMRQFSSMSITPRYDSRKLTLSLPVALTYDYSALQVGAAARFGPVFVGSDNLGGVFGLTEVSGFNLYAGLGIGLFKKKIKDKDKDKVSDKLDECKNIPGLWVFKGCPDSDNDSIPDKDDDCPMTAGVKALNGCPDADGDLITDKLDDCPNDPGPKEFNGCPDTDGDLIIDKLDSCVNDSGLAIYNGCPDTDGDSIIDKRDLCPEIAGIPLFNGCPDSDQDGLPDKDDRCPNDSGSVVLNGCPDKDFDGVADRDDQCPDVPGPVDNFGCPKQEKKVEPKIELLSIEEEEEEILREVYSNLEFDLGKTTIRSTSFVSLGELATLLNKKKDYRLYIAGHTDNIGDDKSNQTLSEGRANAVKDYLISQGVEAGRIDAYGFGESQPVATNKTKEGRQKNRRVEFKLIR